MKEIKQKKVKGGVQEPSKYDDLQHQERTKQCANQIKIKWCSSTACITDQNSVINAGIIFYKAQQKGFFYAYVKTSRCCL